MNREIIFRGMRVGGNEWVYGDLIHDKNGFPHIVPQNQGFDFDDDRFEIYEVITATVGQFTGIRDKNGMEIYEGDICDYRKCDGKNYYGVVKYHEDGFDFWRNNVIDCSLRGIGGRNIEVIGNIHDNREQL